ncbi:MAG TPA: NIL domain-containing protein [Armatimonadota bacterium]|nr:NIL domain-containing protein [Armatimonadota bacterium]
MATKAIKLIFPQELIQEPVTFRMAKQFNLVPNIRRARVTESVGELVLELEGAEQDIEQGIRYLQQQGVQVTDAAGDILE